MQKNLAPPEKNSSNDEENYSELLEKAIKKLQKKPKKSQRIDWVVVKKGHSAIQKMSEKEKILHPQNEICRCGENREYRIIDISTKEIVRRR